MNLLVFRRCLYSCFSIKRSYSKIEVQNYNVWPNSMSSYYWADGTSSVWGFASNFLHSFVVMVLDTAWMFVSFENEKHDCLVRELNSKWFMFWKKIIWFVCMILLHWLYEITLLLQESITSFFLFHFCFDLLGKLK